MKVTVISANEWVYPDVFTYQTASTEISLHTPRGSYASAQLLIPDCPIGAKIDCTFEGDLPFTAYRMLDVIVERNSGDSGNRTGHWWALDNSVPKPYYSTRQAPFPVFDIMQPLDEEPLTVEKSTTAFYVCWKISENVKPGDYIGKVCVTIGDNKAFVPVKVTVHRATVPAVGRLQVTNWYQLRRVGSFDGLKEFSEEWYVRYKKLMMMMRRTRQTYILLPLTIGVTETEPEKYAFDFSEMERMIRLAIDCGFTTLELGHICLKNYQGAKDRYWLFYQKNREKIVGNTPEGYNFLAQFLPKWAAFLKEHGWYEMAVQHIGDEPNENSEMEYRSLCGIVRKFMPGIKLFDATCNVKLAGTVDCWVLQNIDYQLDQDKYEHYRDLGDELWQYTCCSPSGIWLNRLLDGELLKPRLLHYGNYKYNLTGYLHWGFNCYQNDMDILRKNTCGLSHDDVHYWPAGDTHITYPGNGHGPWFSVRAERMRCGIEDCELLWMIADKDKNKADALCDHVMQAFDQFTTDVPQFEKNYEAILEAVDAIQ